MNTNPWTTQLFDQRYLLRCRLGTNDCYTDVEIYTIYIDSDGKVCYQQKGSHSYPDVVEDFEQAERYLHGSIKWDGCSNLDFDDHERGVSLHFCDKKDVVEIGEMLGILYDMAKSAMEKADW